MDQIKNQLIAFSAFKSDSNIYGLVWSIVTLTIIEQLLSFTPQIKEWFQEVFNHYFKKAKDKIEHQTNSIILQKTAAISFSRQFPKTDQNNGYQNSPAVSDFDLADSIIDFCAKLPQSKSIDYGRFFYVNHIEPIQVDQEVHVRFTKFLKATTGELTEICFEVWSYTLSLDKLTKWCNKILADFRTQRQNKLGDQIFYFNEIVKPIPVDRDNKPIFKQANANIFFTMNRFFTTKNLKNIYGEAIDLVKKRIDFFVNNKAWYEKKGIPYSFGLLTYGVPGAGKTSLIKCLSNETKRHIFNISLSEYSTKTQLNNLFYNDTVYVETEQRAQERLVIPQDKRLYIIEDIDCMTDIVLSRDFSSDNLEASESKREVRPKVEIKIRPNDVEEKVESMEEKDLIKIVKEFLDKLKYEPSMNYDNSLFPYYLLLEEYELSSTQNRQQLTIRRYLEKEPNRDLILTANKKLWYQKTFNISFETFKYYIKLKLKRFKSPWLSESYINLYGNVMQNFPYKYKFPEKRKYVYDNVINEDDDEYETTAVYEQAIGDSEFTYSQIENNFKFDFENKLERLLALELWDEQLTLNDVENSSIINFINTKNNSMMFCLEEDQIISYKYSVTFSINDCYDYDQNKEYKIKPIDENIKTEIIELFKASKGDEIKKMVEFGRVSEEEVKSIETLVTKEAQQEIICENKTIEAIDPNKLIDEKIEKKRKELSEEKLTLGYILNLLDGVLEIPGRMIIITTNYPERLDKALIRPGRIDLHVEFTKASCKTIREMVRDFYDLPTSQVEKYNFIGGKWTPAEIHQILFKNFDKPENAISQLCGN